MSLAVDLVAVGIPSHQAEYIGFSALTTMDASQTIPISVNNVIAVTSPGNTALSFSGGAVQMTPYLTTCSTPDALLVRPPLGATINGTTQVSCAQNLARLNFGLSTTRWISFRTA